jgi:hypothetical protein
MSAESAQHEPPVVDAADMIRRKQLEAELLSLDSQVRTFGLVRDRLTANDQDPSAFYRQLQARRATLVKDLKAPPAGPPSVGKIGTQAPIAKLPASLLTRPIAPARFDPNLGAFGFGTSGYVQAAPAEDDYNIVAQGQYPVTGQIVDVPGGYPGVVMFNGDLGVGPDEIDPSQYNPTVSYYWLRTWKYLIPFSPPTTLSNLTYRFDVYAFASLGNGGIGQLMSFVSLGESANLMQGVNVTVNIDGGWPINHDLSQPVPASYNGSYGYIDGSTSVQRTFEVGAGNVPGVAIVVGVVVGLPMLSELDLYFGGTGYSMISIFADNQNPGRIAYSYEPQPVLEP